MKAINVGEMYHLCSPFKSTVSAKHEKKVAYMLGTVSSRPAVVIRPPYAWDEYGTVTVIPVLTNVNPSITYGMQDRYGFTSKSTYTFAPHTPHSVPVSRLQRYMGRLEEHELEELMYAYNWIHSPNPFDFGPVPPCYEEVFKNYDEYAQKKSPMEYMSQLYLDKNMRLTSEHGSPEKIEIDLDLDIPHCTKPTEAIGFSKDPTLHVAPTVIGSATPVESADVKPESPTMVVEAPKKVVHVEYPESSFMREQLDKYANSFTVPMKFYNKTVDSVTVDIITQDEVLHMRGDYSVNLMYEAMAKYSKLTVFDQRFLMVRLPVESIANMLNCDKVEAILIKRLANYINDMPESSVQSRLERLEANRTAAKVDTKTTEPAAKPAQEATTHTVSVAEFEKLRHYLNTKMIHQIPDDLLDAFLHTPTHKLKTAYSGRAFKTNYNAAYKKALDRKKALSN